jgi:hypothetical protein
MPFRDEDFKVIHREAGFTIDAYELTPAEREQFDYHDWAAIDAGTSGATFVRHRGELYDLGSFVRSTNPMVTRLGWHGLHDDTFFSAIVVHLSDDGEEVITGMMVSRD